jgi:hypothetical protein
LVDVSALDGFCRVAALDRRGKWIANGIPENDFLPEVRINRTGVVDIKKSEVL